jgi:5-methyltetrahydrofolate--homocysteine methyltransferase
MGIDDIFGAVIEMEEERVAALVAGELAAGTAVPEILDDGLIAALDEVGDLFSAGEMFVPEMLMAASAAKAGLEVLRPHLTDAAAAPLGVVVMGTVQGDLHDIGKNLVGMMLEGGRFRFVDIGVDVPPARFVEAARDEGADIVAMSALLTTTMPAMRATAAALRESGFEGGIMIGGAPVSLAFADEIGATAFAEDAPGAVREARRLIGRNR